MIELQQKRGMTTKEPDSDLRRPKKLLKPVIYIAAILLHLILIFSITLNTNDKEEREDTSIFKLVDIREYQEKPKEEEKKEEKKIEKPEEKIEVDPQETIAEEITETEKEVVEVTQTIEYLPQHKISVLPVVPTDLIKSRIKYPILASKQNIEGVVILELYVDSKGEIRNIVILKDPGFGFGEAALKALEGIHFQPAKANGTPVAVYFRYPIRFKLK